MVTNLQTTIANVTIHIVCLFCKCRNFFLSSYFCIKLPVCLRVRTYSDIFLVLLESTRRRRQVTVHVSLSPNIMEIMLTRFNPMSKIIKDLICCWSRSSPVQHLAPRWLWVLTMTLTMSVDYDLVDYELTCSPEHLNTWARHQILLFPGRGRRLRPETTTYTSTLDYTKSERTSNSIIGVY